MNNFIPHDIFLKIKEAQDTSINRIKTEVSSEITYISQKFLSELQKNLDVLLSDPFNIYLKIPRQSNNHSKQYLEELKKQYFQSFHHDLQINDGHFFVLLKHINLVSNGDPRPQQLMSTFEDSRAEESDRVIFNDADKKKFESELESNINTSKRPSVRSGYSGEKKDILVPLFLQRRNSRLSLPTISARRQADPVSVSDNPEVSEAN